MTIEQARELAEKTLSEKRFYHTCCVARQAVLLAKRFGEDESEAELAGYLHDIVKERESGELLQMLEGSDIIELDDIKKCPKIWHAFAGGVYAKKVLGVSDAVANSISYHSTGRDGMTSFEMLVFLADYTSADRSFSGVDEVRELCEQSLVGAMKAALRDQITHLLKKELHVDCNSIRAFNYLVEIGG